jgi:hypothetical protein
MLRLNSLIVVGLLVVAGCATSGKTDWPGRIGNYTYDNAVKELGPPDKTETLADGVRVADWFVTRRGGPMSRVAFWQLLKRHALRAIPGELAVALAGPVWGEERVRGVLRRYYGAA